MLQAQYFKYILEFKQPAGTSRGVLCQKETWFVKLTDTRNPTIYGIGECAMFKGLSSDDRPEFEQYLNEVCQNINRLSQFADELINWPAIRFGFESAQLDLKNGGNQILFPSPFTQGKRGIVINGLIWMGEADFIQKQVADKLKAGFKCLKFKIGVNVDSEIETLHNLRKQYNANELEIRLDANGSFAYPDVMYVLKNMAKYNIHSIEQPIKAGQPEAMHEICRVSPIAIALDEELIGLNMPNVQQNLLKAIKPQYIILKPSLVGGFEASNQWIKWANAQNIGWWVTSALESNIGLNAIAQYTATLNNAMPQGLGTGALYTNNIPSPLYISGQELFLNPSVHWANLNSIFGNAQ